MPTAANAWFYAEIVAERAVLRRLVDAGTRIVQMGYGTGGGDVEEIVNAAQAEVYKVADKRGGEDYHLLGELLEAACPGTDYAGLAEEARIARLLEELATARPLTSPFLAYSEETGSELAIFRAAAEARRLYGPAAVANCIISKANFARRGRTVSTTRRITSTARSNVSGDRFCGWGPKSELGSSVPR